MRHPHFKWALGLAVTLSLSVSTMSIAGDAPPSQASNQAAEETQPEPKSQQAPAGGEQAGERKPEDPQSQDETPGQSHQTTTICHATGSETNPYVVITVSDAAVEAHRNHQDGRDIIPAPAGGCPAPVASDPEPDPKTDTDTDTDTAPPADDTRSVTICHATGSVTNPYVKITISENAVPAHRDHQDGRDIIPAPAGECPVDTGIESAPAGPTTVPPTDPDGPGEPAAEGAVAPAAVDGPAASSPSELTPVTVANRTSPDLRGDVLGEVVSSPDPTVPVTRREVRTASPGTESAGPVADRRESGARVASGQLPFTGLEVWIVLAAGAALLMAGLALRSLPGRNLQP